MFCRKRERTIVSVFVALLLLTIIYQFSNCAPRNYRHYINRTEHEERKRQIYHDEIYRIRISTLHARCGRIPPTKFKTRAPEYFFTKAHSLAFCKVPKAGSTFAGTIVHALEETGKLGNIFYVNREYVHGRDQINLHTLKKQNEPVLMILVSRNPYTRLYSAYLDKYFVLGRRGQEMAKGLNKTQLFKTKHGFCGYNISFQDFLDYVTDRGFAGKDTEEHMAPVYSLCDPCRVHYDVICKSETLAIDTQHVLDVINVPQSKKDSIKNMIRGKGLNETLFSLIASHLDYYHMYKYQCSDKYMFLAKLWTLLQYQGYVQSRRSFPLEDFKNLPLFKAKPLTDLIIQHIHSEPASKGDMRKQREKALTAAYRQIEPATIQKVQKMYAPDFALFDYDKKPP